MTKADRTAVRDRPVRRCMREYSDSQGWQLDPTSLAGAVAPDVRERGAVARPVACQVEPPVGAAVAPRRQSLRRFRRQELPEVLRQHAPPGDPVVPPLLVPGIDAVGYAFRPEHPLDF